MSKTEFRNWQSVHEEVLRRINAREWKPGQMIPNEADLALEFGCARATVNRALREIAETGLLERRRKAGTRVTEQPLARATLDIPVIRQEVEARGQRYQHRLMKRDLTVPPSAVSAAMATDPDAPLLHLIALHLADARPYAFEDRWINPEAAPGAKDEAFTETSGNEWLLLHTPYTHGEIAFSAANATEDEADALACAEGAALLVLDRMTWNKDLSVTKVRLVFSEGHQLRAIL
ncbi:MAG: GntR family transcriptional regulator [Pseudomonadota bacterium]